MYRTKAYDFCSIANVNMIFNGAYSVSSRAVNRIALNNRGYINQLLIDWKRYPTVVTD